MAHILLISNCPSGHFIHIVKEQTMPTPCYISIQGQTQGNITAGAFTPDSVGNI
jgi:hypothetical protein